MQRFLLIALTAFVFPLTALANPVDLTNQGGTLSGSSAGLSLSGSTLIGFSEFGMGTTIGTITGNLGTLTLSTTALSSGNLQQGATFSAGGSFVITGNGSVGIHNGTIFNGTFSGPVTWGLFTAADGTHYYSLSGTVTGTWYTGSTVNGAFVSLTLPTGAGFFNGSVVLGSGNSVITLDSVPEPGTLVLVGTGVTGLAGVFRRRRIPRAFPQ